MEGRSIRTLPAWLAPAALLTACASGPAPAPELIVEGRVDSYAAFEAAAGRCGYRGMTRFAGGEAAGHAVGPHLNLYDVRSRSAQCALRWLDDHPEAGLVAMAH